MASVVPIVRIQEDNPKWDQIVLGHEFSGEIVELGEDVTGWQVATVFRQPR